MQVKDQRWESEEQNAGYLMAAEGTCWGRDRLDGRGR